MAARTGKIARLPFKLREDLNRRLLDGLPGSKILPWLNSLSEVQKLLAEDFEGLRINDQNLSDWRMGGFQEWLKQRERIARTRELADYAAQHARAGAGGIAEGAQAIASGKLLELLEALDDAVENSAGKKLGGEDLVNIVGALTALRTSEQNDVRLKQNEKRLDQSGEKLKLEREKFQRDTAEIALKVLADDRAKQIEAGAGTNAEKIEMMGAHIFGDLWKPRDAK